MDNKLKIAGCLVLFFGLICISIPKEEVQIKEKTYTCKKDYISLAEEKAISYNIPNPSVHRIAWFSDQRRTQNIHLMQPAGEGRQEALPGQYSPGQKSQLLLPEMT